jgi:sigma-B regulation protein RsbU (phosphoserine phosphatase)
MKGGRGDGNPVSSAAPLRLGLNGGCLVKILIAEDDVLARRTLQVPLTRWGYQVVIATDGTEALRVLESSNAPKLAILDWMMPGLDGVEVCRRVRENPRALPAYLILLTARGASEDVIQGLDAGANDYVTKPFDRDELRARVKVGVRVVELQTSLADRVSELERALAGVKQLQGLLPICCYCKKIRDDRNYWQQVEGYISDHSEAQFSHGVCPACYEEHVRPELAKPLTLVE